MDEKVKAFMDKSRQKKDRERNRYLIKLGLYDVEFGQGETTADYPLYDSKAGKAFRCVFPELSDEEYAEVIAYAKRDEASRGNTLANILKIIAWICYIGGFLLGIFLAIQNSLWDIPFSWRTALSYWTLSFVCGTVFLGFAEIIALLHRLVINSRDGAA